MHVRLGKDLEALPTILVSRRLRILHKHRAWILFGWVLCLLPAGTFYRQLQDVRPRRLREIVGRQEHGSRQKAPVVGMLPLSPRHASLPALRLPLIIVQCDGCVRGKQAGLPGECRYYVVVYSMGTHKGLETMECGSVLRHTYTKREDPRHRCIEGTRHRHDTEEILSAPETKMASNDTPRGRVRVLVRPEDWEPWVWQIRAEIHWSIWPCIDPDLPVHRLEPLLEKPVKPSYRDLNPKAVTYRDLVPAQQQGYHNLRSYYNDDLKEYQQQQDQLAAARWIILCGVAEGKQALLDPNLSVRDWMVLLKRDTVPAASYMLTLKPKTTAYVDNQYKDEFYVCPISCDENMKQCPLVGGAPLTHVLRKLRAIVRPVFPRGLLVPISTH